MTSSVCSDCSIATPCKGDAGSLLFPTGVHISAWTWLRRSDPFIIAPFADRPERVLFQTAVTCVTVLTSSPTTRFALLRGYGGSDRRDDLRSGRLDRGHRTDHLRLKLAAGSVEIKVENKSQPVKVQAVDLKQHFAMESTIRMVPATRSPAKPPTASTCRWTYSVCARVDAASASASSSKGQRGTRRRTRARRRRLRHVAAAPFVA